MTKVLAAVLALAVGGVAQAENLLITGAGATFPFPQIGRAHV